MGLWDDVLTSNHDHLIQLLQENFGHSHKKLILEVVRIYHIYYNYCLHINKFYLYAWITIVTNHVSMYNISYKILLLFNN